ncbi:hypothetical protein Tco_1314795 [Tanacetum coccineum]
MELENGIWMVVYWWWSAEIGEEDKERVEDGCCDHHDYLHEKVEFRRISLTGFHSRTSGSYYQSISKQTTRYPYEASHGHKIEI